jgi:hypothetical protein
MIVRRLLLQATPLRRKVPFNHLCLRQRRLPDHLENGNQRRKKNSKLEKVPRDFPCHPTVTARVRGIERRHSSPGYDPSAALEPFPDDREPFSDILDCGFGGILTTFKTEI